MSAEKEAKRTLQAWERFEKTLQSVSPKTFATLLPGASAKIIAEAEKELEFKLPPDVRAFYERHNGEEPTDDAADGVFERCYFIPLTGGVDSAVSESLHWDTAMKYPNSSPPRMKGRKITWEMTKYWLTFGKDYGGNLLIVDCDPKRKKPGEVFYSDHEATHDLKVIATGMADFLDQEREKLQKGARDTGRGTAGEEDDDDDDTNVGDNDDDLLDELIEDEAEAEMEGREAADDDDEDDEDYDEDDDEDDDDSAGRHIEDRGWLEVVVKLPNVKKREIGAKVQTATMKEMDLVLEFVSPDVVLKNIVGREYGLTKNNVVAITVYVGSDPSKRFLEGYGGDGALIEPFLFEGDKMYGAAEGGHFHASIRKGTPGDHLPIFYWKLFDGHTEEIGLQITLKRRDPNG